MLSPIDARLPYIMVEALRLDLGSSDPQIGLITGPAFSLTYALCAIPVAKLSDRKNRVVIIGLAMAFWSAFTALAALFRARSDTPWSETSSQAGLCSAAFALATATQIAGLRTDHYGLFLVLLAVIVLLSSFYLAPTHAALHSLADPNARSFPSAVTSFCISGLGLALGSFLVGGQPANEATNKTKNGNHLSMTPASVAPVPWALFSQLRGGDTPRGATGILVPIEVRVA